MKQPVGSALGGFDLRADYNNENVEDDPAGNRERGACGDQVRKAMKVPQSDSPVALDAIDRRILASLQEDGRMTNVDLSKRAGISAPPCLRRVRALEEAGVIRGYHADTDPQLLGWEITFFAIVGLDSQKEAVLSAFEQQVGAWSEVRECHMIRGGGDFLLRLVARDTAHENQLTQRLTGIPTVSRVQTLQTIRTSRNLAGVPL